MKFLAALLLLVGVGCAGTVSPRAPVDIARIYKGAPAIVADFPEEMNPAVKQTFSWMLLGHPSRFDKQYLWLLTVYGSKHTIVVQPFQQRYFAVTYRGMRPYQIERLTPLHMTPATVALYEFKGYSPVGQILYDRSDPVVFYGVIIPYVGFVAHTSPSIHGTPASHYSQSSPVQ